MRLLVIANNFPSPSDPQNGVFVLNQLKALARTGCDISVLRALPFAFPFRRSWRRYGPVPRRYVIDGFSVQTFRAWQLTGNLATEHIGAAATRKVLSVARTLRSDIVHAHGLIWSGFLAAHAGVPSVVTAHGSDAYDYPWRRAGLTAMARQITREAGALAAVSEFVRGQLLRLGASEVHVIYNGADDAIFKPGPAADARRELGEALDRPTIVFVGHLLRSKGIYELAAAVERLHDIRPRLLLVGAGVERARLEARLRASGADFKFFGELPHADLPTIYRAADVFALPSHREGLPAAVCEAMLAGRPVVAAAVGGVPEIVRDGETGFTVPAGDAAALADALRAVFADARRRDDMARAARAFAERRLTWKANASAYREIYDRLRLRRVRSEAR